MKDRFDLENCIMDLFSTAGDIQTVADMVYDSNLKYSPDRLHTVLSGLAEVLEAKVEKTNQVFVEVFKLNEYAEDSEVMEARKRFTENLAAMVK